MKYKLTINPALEVNNFFDLYMFETKEELNAASRTASGLLIFLQDEAEVMEDYSNMFIEEELIDGEWEVMD